MTTFKKYDWHKICTFQDKILNEMKLTSKKKTIPVSEVVTITLWELFTV